jgi:hypothetical protein
MKVLVVLALLFCVQAAFGRWGHHDHHHAPEADSQPACHFQTDKGSYDLRLMTRDLNKKDLELRSENLKTSFFYNPCGDVHNEKCPKGAALCEIDEKGVALSFGRADNLTWNEGQDLGVELAYGGGDACANGIPRKTLVQFSCSRPTKEKETHRTVITDFSLKNCVVTMKVSSPYGCPVEELCTVYDKEECKNSEGLCEWNKKNGTCTYTSSSCFQFGKHHLSLFKLLALTFGVALATVFCCSACICVCRRRRQKKLSLPVTSKTGKCKKSKKSKKSKKTEEPAQEMQLIPEPQFIYQPLQQYPGQQYAQAYAVPMVQFAPAGSIQGQ